MVPADGGAGSGSRGGSGSRDSLPPLPEPLPHPVVDNHCHMDMSGQRGGEDLPVGEALRLADSVGVTRIVQIGCDVPGARWAVQAAQEYDTVVAGVALHPNEAPRLAEAGDLDDALAAIDRLAGISARGR